MMIKNPQQLAEKAIENIIEDRACANKLITDLMIIMAQENNSDSHKKLGEVASRYLETLQRSNEQLVKLTAISAKLNDAKKGFSKNEIDSIYGEVLSEEK